jgi:hypothetical protein
VIARIIAILPHSGVTTFGTCGASSAPESLYVLSGLKSRACGAFTCKPERTRDTSLPTRNGRGFLMVF